MKHILTVSILTLLVLSSCNKKKTLFTLLPSSKTGVKFNNHIFEDDEINIIKLEYVYNGGGVAVGDFNNDGLSDLFFTGNMVDNALYLNKGKMKFEDISETAGIGGSGKWKSGVALVDINADGWLDIYVCATIQANSEKRKNMFFINQGLNSDGVPTFKDEAEAYGLADDSYSSNAVFLDYDKDQDMDLFVLVNSKQYGVPTTYRPKVTDGSSTLTDKLFRNNGDGTFTDVSSESGILIEGHGLGVRVFDVNQDGWQDIYVANDFLTTDVLYVNHEGTFKDEIDQYFKHQSKFSMGTDAADINNDGYQDLITVDMMPETNLRKKTVIQGGMYINYINDARYGYTHQFTRNMLQVNNGNETFSELGQFSGIHQTEWSWSPLFADFNNDGYRDLMITNGFPKDITDKDFINYRMEVNNIASAEYLDSQMPSVKVPNYAYKNLGNNTFEDASKAWGITQPSFSNGAAFADLDNDGDLDYIVNNIYDEAFIYKNNLNPLQDPDNVSSNFLRVKLIGPKENIFAVGTKLGVYTADKLQIHEHAISRGYISSVEDIAHFGLNGIPSVDSVIVLWPDGTKSKVSSPETNQTLFIDYNKTERVNSEMTSFLPYNSGQQLVQKVNEEKNINFTQPNYDLIDYSLQRTIPHKFSQYGPSIAVGDINQDGLEDFITGSYTNDTPSIYIQNNDGTFQEQKLNEEEGIFTDGGMLLFDADLDGDLDLYIVSSGFDKPEGDPAYIDRFYRNNGGQFTLEKNAIPDNATSGSVVRGSDIDQDGDIDLFIGGRVAAWSYPYAPKSSILINENGIFKDKTAEINAALESVGMVTDALWTDYDNDGDEDLIVTGEFMPIKVFINNGGKLVYNEESGLENYSGWWNSIIGGDFDNDGDIDYVAGNLGYNNSYAVTEDHPIYVYATDIDNNNSVDAVLACYYKFADGSYKLCPVNYWEELAQQSPVFRKRFTSYSEYGMATIDSLFTEEELERALKLMSNYMASSFLQNNGDGTFTISELPLPVQVAPVNGMISDDVNGDGNLDILLIGNDYGNEVAVGVMDALNGMILLGNGDGTFQVNDNGHNGFFVPGDGKALASLVDKNNQLYLASQNKGALLAFKPLNRQSNIITAENGETSALIHFENGKTRKIEFYLGAGFLTQSSRAFSILKTVTSIDFYKGKDKTRTINTSELQ